MRCPDYLKLIAAVRGKTSTQEAAEIMEHLAACPSCKAQAQEIQKLVSFYAEEAAIKISLQARARAFKLLADNKKPLSSTFVGWRRVLTNLVFDSATAGFSGVPAGVRSSDSSQAVSNRQLLFQFEEGQIEIDLQISLVKTEERYRVFGQLLGLDEMPQKIELTMGTNLALQTAPDKTGTFYFEGLVRGDYLLKAFCQKESLELEMEFSL